ncbi:MAG: hypothetical protein LBQ12_09190 [Deltaproteobacteria bacterium]|jgi:hypothetical protein|nr:hypothetical protein [Deltaproteobacteria bacterium]
MVTPASPGSRPARLVPAAPPAVSAVLAVLAVLAAVLALAPPSPLAAQEAPPPLAPEIFNGQKPVTEADLGLAVDLIRQGREGNATAADMEALARRHKVDDPYRAAYVASRFGAGFLMLKRGATPAQIQELYGTPLAVPSAAELEAIGALLPKIEAELGLKK